jgi:drug/metabolite transporter (DMT)-like permease
MAALRWTVAGGIVAAIVWARGGRLPGRDAWPGAALLGLLMIGFGNGFVVYAEQYVPSGLTAVVIATSPFWMVGVEALLPSGERPGAGAMAGLLVGFAGIVLLVWPDLRAGGAGARQFGAGLVALQLACAGWALGSAYSKRHRQAADVLGATALQMVFGGALMALVAALLGEWSSLSFTPRSAAALIYLTTVGSVGAFVAYVYALGHLPVSTVSLYAYVNPVIAVVLGALVLGEPFTPRVVAAAGIVLAGLAIVRSSGGGPRRLASADEGGRRWMASVLKRVTS